MLINVSTDSTADAASFSIFAAFSLTVKKPNQNSECISIIKQYEFDRHIQCYLLMKLNLEPIFLSNLVEIFFRIFVSSIWKNSASRVQFTKQRFIKLINCEFVKKKLSLFLPSKMLRFGNDSQELTLLVIKWQPYSGKCITLGFIHLRIVDARLYGYDVMAHKFVDGFNRRYLLV